MDTAPLTLDADHARAWLAEALRALAAVRTKVDALNVFPVPDADTGTNVVLTVTAGARAAQRVGDDADLSTLTTAMAKGALWGARGNSGIIISQAFQALARTFAGLSTAGPTDLIRALDAIAIAAHDAVADPVEGTIITVARDVAEAVVNLPIDATLRDVAATAHAAGIDSLSRTGQLLGKEIGTAVSIDAGAASYVVLLDTLAEALGASDRDPIPWNLADDASAPHEAPAGEGEFEVMYVTKTDRRYAQELRSKLRAVGYSVAVVAGQDDYWHVHVHLDEPTQALPTSPVEQVLVRHLQAPATRFGLVATTTGVGLLDELARCGAVTALNPSRAALIKAVIDTGATDVTILPASEQLAELARLVATDPEVSSEGIEVSVAPTDCDPLVFAVCTEWGIARLMNSDVHPLDLAQACDAEVEIHEITASASADPERLVQRALQTFSSAEGEVVTLFVGESIAASRLARSMARALAARGIEVYECAAGQPRPDVWVLNHG